MIPETVRTFDPAAVRPEEIDLHMHSTVSDGTDTPAELLRKVREAGLRVFALTDHDALEGCREIEQLLAEDPEAAREVFFLRSVEFSCRDMKGSYHILGYGYDPDAEPIRALAAATHEARMRKLHGRLARLRTRHGIEFPPEEIEALTRLSNPGKPHIGNLMVRHGYAETRAEAITMIGDPPELHSLYFRPEQAIEAIASSGGIPVLAHPSYGSGNQRIYGSAMEERVRHLLDFGIRGLEAYYSEFSPKLIAENLALAEKYDLYVTAGSDHHGGNKKIPLGRTQLTGETLPERTARFIRDAGGLK